MEIRKVGKNFAAAIALLTVGMVGAIDLTNDAGANTSHTVAKKTVYTKQANARKTCAKVAAENTSGENVVYKLNVRSRMYGPVIQQLDDDTTVTVVRRFPNGWAQISSPVQGYVFGEFLKGC